MTSSNPNIVGIEQANENMLDIGEGMKLWVIIYIDYNLINFVKNMLNTIL